MKRNMKKTLGILAAAALMGSLCACGSSGGSSTTEAAKQPAEQTTAAADTEKSEAGGGAQSAAADFTSIRDKGETDGKIHVIAKGLTAGNAFWNTVRQSLVDIDESSEIGGTDVNLLIRVFLRYQRAAGAS